MNKRKNDWIASPLITRRRLIGVALMAVLLAGGFHILRDTVVARSQNIVLSDDATISFETATSIALASYPNARVNKVKLHEGGLHKTPLWHIHLHDADGDVHHVHIDISTRTIVATKQPKKSPAPMVADAISYQEAASIALGAYEASQVTEISYHNSAPHSEYAGLWHVHINGQDGTRAIIKIDAQSGVIIATDVKNRIG